MKVAVAPRRHPAKPRTGHPNNMAALCRALEDAGVEFIARTKTKGPGGKVEVVNKGVLFAAGPVNTEAGAPTGGGMALFDTTTADEARRYAEGDPFYLKGLRSFKIHEWVLMEGSMTVTLNFAEVCVPKTPSVLIT